MSTAFAGKQITAATPLTSKERIEQILSLSVPISVTLAERDMKVDSLLTISVGTIVEFEVSFDADLTLHVANRPIATGHAVKVGENFGMRLTTVESLEDRIDALGKK